jgi:hypothetical protein
VSTLLRADAEVIPFRGREAELAGLAQWCDSAEEFDVRLLVGPGGQGKTRLGRQLVHIRAGVGWTAGFLAADPPGQPLDLTAIADTATPTLLVVDYAETRTSQITRLLHNLEDAADIGPVRILLLARSAGRWWDKLRQRHSSMLGMANVSVLHTLDDSLAARQNAFDRAIDSFAQALAEASPDTNWEDIASPGAAPEGIAAEQYGMPLTLQMTALIALLDNASGPTTASQRTALFALDAAPVPLEQQILDHEQRYWEETAADHDLELHPITLSLTVAATILLGASGSDEAMASLARFPWLEGQPEDRRIAVDSWLCDLYPATPFQHWGPLQPDRVAEFHVGIHLSKDPKLLNGLLSEATDRQVIQAWTILQRARSHQPHIAEQLQKILEGDTKRFVPVVAAVEVSTRGQVASPPREIIKIYSTVGIEERRAILNKWFDRRADAPPRKLERAPNTPSDARRAAGLAEEVE